MKKLQMITVLVLSFLFVIACVSEEDEEDFWEDDQSDTYSGGNSGGDGDTLPESPTDTGSSDTLPETPADTDSSDTLPDTTDTTYDPSDSDVSDSGSVSDTDSADTDSADTDSADTDSANTDTGVVAPTETEEEKCVKAGGTWGGSKCTKEGNCGSKPENTDWNDGNGKFTQTLNGTTWTPASKNAFYGAGECGFKCFEKYFWNGSSCVNPCNPDPCGSNAEPDSCEASDATTYTCGCVDGYHWENNKCVSNCPDAGTHWEDNKCVSNCPEAGTHWENDGCADNSRTVPCKENPANSHWNEGVETTVAQTWTADEGWTPSAEGVYDPEGTAPCSFSCDDGFTWKNGKCAPPIPDCGPGSETPCIDPKTEYIWSALLTTKCSDLPQVDGVSGSWKLPDIGELRTLIRYCEATQYPDGTAENVAPSCNNTNCNHNGCGSATEGPAINGYSIFEEKEILQSSTEIGLDHIYVWVVNFSTAAVFPGIINSNSFRCIYVPEN